MRMQFDVNVPGDEDAAHATRTSLVADFERWLDAHPHRATLGPAEAWDADLLLGWKWGYGDGHYGRWTRADVDDVLLDHLPRKLSAPPDAAASIPASLAALAHFLDERGLLDADGDPADVVAARALAQQRAFLDAMDDPANYGMAKGLFSSLGFDVDDLPDQAALDAAIARFNDLPFDERGDILGLDGPEVPDDVDLPPLPLRAAPSADAVAAHAGDVPLLRKVEAFARALGPSGVTLTKAGNIKVADGRRLVAATGVADRVEGVRSTTELRELFAVSQVAQHAAAVEVRGNRLRAAEEWANVPVTTRWQRVVDAVIDAGAATLAFGASVPMPAQLAELADQVALHALAILWMADEPVPVAVLVDVMEEATNFDPADGAIGLRFGRDHVRTTCAARVDDVLESLGDAGVVVVDDDGVALTEAGITLAAPILSEAGFGVLLPDDVAKLDAAGLIDALTQRDGGDIALAAQLWAAGRPAGEAPPELVDELVARPEPARMMVGFAVLKHLGPGATDAIRGLTDGPLAGHAWLFLADEGVVDPDSVPREVVARAGVDLFAAVADVGSPADVVEMILGNIPAGDVPGLIDNLATTDHP